MSKFSKTSTFFKRNNLQQVNVITKVSQKELKKNKKTQKNNSNNSNDFNIMTENDFNKLMEENDNMNISQENLNCYIKKILQIDILKQLVNEEIKGEYFINKIKLENKIKGSQLLYSILNKYTNPNNWNWINKNEYGEILKNLLEDDYEEQLLCLLLIQNYCINLGLPKIIYKDKEVYFIKFIFQLMFTQDIIDESVYWKWQELSTIFMDIEENIKNKICIQTTDFFNILKMTFTEEDYEEDNQDNQENKINKNNQNNKNNQKSKKNDIKNDDEESDVESENEDQYIIPEEQDYNMDDNNFNIDDI